MLWGETWRKSDEGVRGYKATNSGLHIYNSRNFAPEVERKISILKKMK